MLQMNYEIRGKEQQFFLVAAIEIKFISLWCRKIKLLSLQKNGLSMITLLLWIDFEILR